VPRYKIYRNQEYYWEGKHGTFKISIVDANQLFYEYSRHGLNMSSTSVRLQHDMSIKMWHSLKYHLSLYKDSHIISPFTLENTPVELRRAMISERMDAKERDKERVLIEEHNKSTFKEYNKVIDEFRVKDLAIEEMLNTLSETIEIPEIIIKEADVSSADGPIHIMAMVADLHIGGEAKNLLATPDYNYNILRERLSVVATEINAVNAAEVSVMFLGDLIESMTGLNHLSTWHGVQDGAWGAQVFKMAVEAIIEFLNQIVNLREVIGIAGNHDRTDHDKKVDPYGSVAEMIFYTLGKIYGDTLPIEFHYLLKSITRDGINYMATHGDKPVFKKNTNAAEGVLQYGQPGMFNIVVQGHLHSRNILADHNMYRWIQAPAIFSGNTWSEENAFHARPGFIICYLNKRTNQPVITDYTI